MAQVILFPRFHSSRQVLFRSHTTIFLSTCLLKRLQSYKWSTEYTKEDNASSQEVINNIHLQHVNNIDIIKRDSSSKFLVQSSFYSLGKKYYFVDTLEVYTQYRN